MSHLSNGINIKRVAAGETYVITPEDDIILIQAGPGNSSELQLVDLPVGTPNKLFYIKRTDGEAGQTVKITSVGTGIDGVTAQTIDLQPAPFPAPGVYGNDGQAVILACQTVGVNSFYFVMGTNNGL